MYDYKYRSFFWWGNRHRREILFFTTHNIPFQLRLCSERFMIHCWSHVDDEPSFLFFSCDGLKCCSHNVILTQCSECQRCENLFQNKRGQTAGVTMNLYEGSRMSWCLLWMSKWMKFKRMRINGGNSHGLLKVASSACRSNGNSNKRQSTCLVSQSAPGRSCSSGRRDHWYSEVEGWHARWSRRFPESWRSGP